MNAKKRSIGWKPVVLSAVAVSMLVPALALAQRGNRPGRGDGGEWKAPRERMAERLNLSDEQQDKMQDLRREHQKQMLLHRGEMASLRAQMEAEFLSDSINEGKVKSLSAEISRLRSQMDESRLEHRLAMGKILTAEQREELQSFRGAGRRGGFHRGGAWGGRGSGRGERGDCQGCPHGGPGGGFLGQGFDDGDGPGFGPWWMDGDEGDESPSPPPAPGGDDEELR